MIYIKLKKDSEHYKRLKPIFSRELRQVKEFWVYQKETLPEFDGTENSISVWNMYATETAWRFRKVPNKSEWRPVKRKAGYYEPNIRTRKGKILDDNLEVARGIRFKRICFVDIFKLTIHPREFVVPNGFITDNEEIFMQFDDSNYSDLHAYSEGQFVELTREEYEYWKKIFIEKFNKDKVATLKI